MTGMCRKVFLLALLVAAVPSGLLVAPGAHADAPRGIAVTPRNFPDHLETDIDDAFIRATEVGRHAVSINQWGDLDPKVVRQVVKRMRGAGLVPVLGLSPTTLGHGRAELDLPESVRRKAGGKISFANPVIREAFIDTAVALGRLHPDYLCLATEINLLAMQKLPEYLHFAKLYKEAYHAVKRVAPQTRVFVSFQWEAMRLLDAREPGRIGEHSKVIDIFRPELDLVALTSYPAPVHEKPARLPDDYYQWIFRHIPRSDAVMFMEIGWPTEGVGNRREQRQFIERLPELLTGINLVGIEWALLHDVTIFDADLNSVGLRERDGRQKPGFSAFRALRVP